MNSTPVRHGRWLPLAAMLFAAANPVAAAAPAAGYLAPSERPDSAALLPSPPQPGSPELAADEAAYREFMPLAATARWSLAGRDSNLQFPGAVDASRLLAVDLVPGALDDLAGAVSACA